MSSYVVAVRSNPGKKTYSVAKRKISSISSTGDVVEVNGNLVLRWRYQIRINRPDLADWPIWVYGVDEREAARRLSNICHDFEADGYTYQPALNYEVQNPL